MKLYYTDPLIAAYMAREFGVILLVYRYTDTDYAINLPNGKGFEWSNDWVKTSELLVTIPIEGGNIHPKSHHIFEPKVGDLLDGWASRMGHVEEITDEDYVIDVHGGSWGCPKSYSGHIITYEIIQRDNKHFFMPEVENDTS